ncbi:hypothetical protein CARUB_v10028447mg, partial [Capsella rubella]
MSSIPEDLLAIILSKLSIKIFTTFKLVCKQWESILESPYFRDVFRSTHQNSHTPPSWSLMSWDYGKELVAYNGLNTWGLERSLGSYISSFLTKKFGSKRNDYRVWSYAEVGLILTSGVLNQTFKYFSWPMGIATRIDDKGVFLDYKVVLYYNKDNLLIYSSQTGLWSYYNIVYSYISSLFVKLTFVLHESLHLVARDSEGKGVIVSFNLYATSTDTIQGRTTRFPDSGKNTRFDRSCSTCQGSLVYMNVVPVTKVDGTLEDKLCVWRLKSWEWQLVSEIAWDFIDTYRSHYFYLGINPFDANIVYFESNMQQSLLSVNLHKGEFVLQSKLEHSDQPTQFENLLRSVVFPQWLHRIPNT